MASRATRHAVIDIGTVTCRMLVGDVVDGRVVCVAREYRVTNLGEGVDATGMLSPAAIQRVVDAVSHYVSMLSELAEPGSPAIGVTAIATSAARDAENSAELERALARLGVSLTVVPGEREAALSFAGAASEFFGERVVVVDIGGGSTEVIAGIGGHAPRFARSFNVGCRRATERFFRSDPPLREEIVAARAWVASEMEDFFSKIFAENEAGAATSAVLAEPWRMVAVAGTATSVVSIREAMEVYDSARVHGSVVTAFELHGIAERLASLPLEDRRGVAGLDPNRAPVIVAGLVILEEVMRMACVASFTASESDILQGMILEASGLFAAEGAGANARRGGKKR